MATFLSAAGRLLAADSALLTVSESYPAATLTPTPGAALALESTTSLAKQTYTIDGLSAAPAVTMFLVFDKLPAAQMQHALLSIATQDGVFYSLLFGGTNSGDPAVQGFGLNSYVSASSSLPGNPLDNQKLVLVTAKLYNPADAGEFSMRLNGVGQTLVERGLGVGTRLFTNVFTLGGFGPGGPNLDWLGNKFACYLYLSDLPLASCQRTERYLRSKYPAVA